MTASRKQSISGLSLDKRGIHLLGNHSSQWDAVKVAQRI